MGNLLSRAEYIRQKVLQGLNRLGRCCTAEEQPIRKSILPDWQRFPKRSRTVLQRQHDHPRRPQADTRSHALRTERAPKLLGEWRRAGVRLVVQEEVAIKIDVVLVGSTEP